MQSAHGAPWWRAEEVVEMIAGGSSGSGIEIVKTVGKRSKRIVRAVSVADSAVKP